MRSKLLIMNSSLSRVNGLDFSKNALEPPKRDLGNSL